MAISRERVSTEEFGDVFIDVAECDNCHKKEPLPVTASWLRLRSSPYIEWGTFRPTEDDYDFCTPLCLIEACQKWGYPSVTFSNGASLAAVYTK
jgi:hypothetical protein